SLTANSETMQSGNSISDGEFLGLYGKKAWGNTSMDFAIYGGAQSFHQQRYINDNMAYLGNSSSNASQGKWLDNSSHSSSQIRPSMDWLIHGIR
ncbi:MAG: hypothetical protein RLZZ516_2212, partial [Cyanobacteriota bacterium]